MLMIFWQKQKMKLHLPLTHAVYLAQQTDYVTFFFYLHRYRLNIIFRELWKTTSNFFRSRWSSREKISFNFEGAIRKTRIKMRFRSFCAQSSRKRRNVTVFRHGAPEYCGSTLPAPVSHLDTWRSLLALARPLGVRSHIACPRDAVDAGDRRAKRLLMRYA